MKVVVFILWGFSHALCFCIFTLSPTLVPSDISGGFFCTCWILQFDCIVWSECFISVFISSITRTFTTSICVYGLVRSFVVR